MNVVVDVVKGNGFDWDDANVYKISKHGLSVEVVEEFFSRKVLILPDSKHSGQETRMLAFGKSHEGRCIIAVFTRRNQYQQELVRVITARYMHKKEVVIYEEIKKAIEG